MSILLDTFLNFFNCSGEEFSTEDYYDNDTTAGVVVAPSEQEILEPANPIGSSSVSSPTSIYSIPSRESMTEIRQDSLHRFSRSPLFFSCTSSTPMRFSFEGEDYGGQPDQLDKRDDSIRSASMRTEHRQLDLVKNNSIATATTADSASVVDDEIINLHLNSTESSMDYQVDVVAVRE